MKKKIGLLMIVVMLLISSGCFVPFPYWGGGGGAGAMENMENTGVVSMEVAVKMLPGPVKFD